MDVLHEEGKPGPVPITFSSLHFRINGLTKQQIWKVV
jgi:hypothetical protein